ncbi:MAG: hypothetical protein JRI23_13185 [Deltaproteobacteria bacterium]|jgi:hypothetical protein|nr:hypothetical protein [Deltaproteobacteria bacterium]MBW2532677.1 hypothetical protein [Deltaproteobacteria bacterium]
MSATIESLGAIDIKCETDGLAATKMARLTFHAWADAKPPYKLKIFSPTGNLIVDRVIRDLPTGEPQAPDPVAFSVVSGEYKITIKALDGKAEGQATLRVP